MHRYDLLGTLRRFLVIVAVAFWLGGFTFYTGVAIPVGMQILGSHLKQGFITQQVTRWINLSAIVAIAILTWNALAVWRRNARWLRVALACTVLIMLAIQVELFILHPLLDRLLDPRTRQILDDDRFDLLHRVYLWSSTVQWGAGVLHVLCLAMVLKD